MFAPNFIPLHALLEHGRSDDHPVCHDGQRLVAWREFSGRVSALAGQLKRCAESRWLLASDDPQRFAIELLALLYAGKEVVIPPNTQPGTLAALADAFDARLPDEEVEPGLDVQGLSTAFDPDRAIIDLYTSGSTGQAKRIRKTLTQFEAEVTVLESLWGPTLGAAAIVATAPHHHIYGLLFRLLWPLASGRVFDAQTCAHPDTLGERLRVLRDAVLVSTPAQLARLPELVALDSLAPKPKAIFSSGGPLSAAAAAEYFRQLGQAPIEVFGSTETGGVAWRRQEAGEAPELWTPFPGMEVRRSGDGALSLRSPFLADDGWWEMDDGVDLMPDGRFRLLGRLDRIVKLEEKRLSLPDMEARLNAHPWVTTSALVPLPGRRQSIGAVLVLNAAGRQQLAILGRRVAVQVLRSYLGRYFETVLLPRHWRFPDALPVSERGKVAHTALAALFSADADLVLHPKVLGASRGECDALVLELHVTPSLTHFSGHFPGMPVLPGVVQLDWAVRFAREYLALSGHFSALENVKFLALVLPDAKLELSLRWDAENRRLEFAYATSERKFSTGRIVFGGAE